MSPSRRVAHRHVGGSLHHHGTHQVGAPDEPCTALDGDRDRLAAGQHLGTTRFRERRRSTSACPDSRPLPHAIGEKDVDLGLVADPSMLESFCRSPARLEAEVDQHSGEGQEHVGLSPHVQDSVDVLGGPWRSVVAVGAV